MRSLLVIALLCSATAEAQELVHVEADDTTRRDLLLEQARGQGFTPVSDGPIHPGSLSPDALAALARAERLIVQGKQAAAQLREGEALAALAEARTLIERNARVPGAAGWLAEAELAIGTVAHQQGRSALAEQSLVRAASLDPTRTLGAAEAPPAVVERARELARAAATRPRTELRLEATVDGARAYLDDRDLGPLPAQAEVAVGRHVVRIEAPGHRPWGRVVDLDEGRHEPWRVALSPTSLEAMRRRIADLPLAEIPSAMLEGTSLLWIELEAHRALVTRCTTEGCAPPARRTMERALEPVDPLGSVALTGPEVHARWERQRRWLEEDPIALDENPRPAPWWRRGTTWAAVGFTALVVGVALGFSLRPDPRQELRVVVDTEGL